MIILHATVIWRIRNTPVISIHRYLVNKGYDSTCTVQTHLINVSINLFQLSRSLAQAESLCFAIEKDTIRCLVLVQPRKTGCTLLVVARTQYRRTGH